MRAKRSRSARLAAFSAVTLAAGALAVPAAQAGNGLGCGDTIVVDTTLTHNVGPCPDYGIIIGADGITLDLGGFTIFGVNTPGDGAGVFIENHTGVTVANGTVSGFDGGVVIQNGGGNTVKSIIARNNVGDSSGHSPSVGTLYGDGIAILGSSDNKILDSTAIKNGPFSGIGLYEVPDSEHPSYPAAPTTNNLVRNNTVQNNVACREGPFCDNDGIRIEPSVGPGNRIILNRVTGNGLDGISLFGSTTGNFVSQNTVKNNGYNGAVPGDGIRVFGFDNSIVNNIVIGNAQDGISVGRRSIAPPGSLLAPNGRDNVIKFNTASRNVAHDMYDSNLAPECDNNRWVKNTFQVAVPVGCIN